MNQIAGAFDETAVRARLRDARRIVVKIGSSSLSSVEGGLHVERINGLVDLLAALHKQGRDVVLISSGAIAAGLRPLGLRRRPRDLAHQQAAAAVGQGLLIERYTERFQVHDILVGQVLLTVEDFTRQTSYANARRTLGALLRMGVVPIINENDTVATHEIRFGDNDRLAALTAQLVRADALLLLTDVDSLYTAHPSDPSAERISFVADADELRVDTSRTGSAVGSGGMTTKLQAAQIASGAGIPVVLTSADRAAAAFAGESAGTAFAPIDKRRPRRLLWLEYASNAQGRLHVDAGAVAAVTSRNASLLAAGITRVEGQFLAGDPVDIVGPDGQPIARGLVGFNSDVLPKMIGRSSRDLAENLGDDFEREIVHRDVLVVLHPGVGSAS
mgnify:CR=1 FL=1